MDKEYSVSKGDELFEAMEEERKRRKKKIIRTAVIITVVAAIVMVIGVSVLRKRVQNRFDFTMFQVQSAQVTRGTISTVVSGSGTLSAVDVEEISVPKGVEVEEVVIKAGKEVKEGDLLVKVNMTSVSSTLSSVQAEIDEIDKAISKAEGDTVSSSVKAGVSGRIKKIFAEKGDRVADVMAEKGALALISLDGYMAVDIKADKLSVGDSVKVKRSDGSKIDGTVETVSGKNVTVLVTDNGPKYNEKVTVLGSDGKEIDSGKLYIHNPLSVTGIAGNVSAVKASLNTKVSASTVVFSLTDTEYSADYESLLRERKEKEEDIVSLLKIRQKGAVTAPFDGLISAVTYTESSALSGKEVSLLNIYPGKSMSVTIGVDETDILSLEVGQEADITVSSVSEDAFTGKVTEINKTAETYGGMTQYSATITFDKAEGMLSGMSLNGDAFFYENALEIDRRDYDASTRSFSELTPAQFHNRGLLHDRRLQRAKVFTCSCCPPNISRMLASITRYMYSVDGDTIYCHQFAASETELTVGGAPAKLELVTNYPTDGKLTYIYHGVPARLAVRIPDWCVEYTGVTENGYAVFDVTDGSTVELELPMEIHFVEANPEVSEDAGRYAVTRGPIVYCLEGVDNGRRLWDIVLQECGEKTVKASGEFGVPVLEIAASRRPAATTLYKLKSDVREKFTAKLIPYFAYANRGVSDMQIWTQVK